MFEIENYINVDGLKYANFHSFPFDHLIIENFLDDDFAHKLENEFFEFESEFWHIYNNAIEDKKTCNNWNRFPSNIYKYFIIINSNEFISVLKEKMKINKVLFPDIGLNGGGMHIHGDGGKLNPHLDYNIHPKINYQRIINIITYLCNDWDETNGGHLGLWDDNKKLIKEIIPNFNKAIIFNTTQNSIHGLSRPVNAKNKYRKSLASYYLCKPPQKTEQRMKALFQATKEQEGNKEIEELIKLRSDINRASDVYK